MNIHGCFLILLLTFPNFIIFFWKEVGRKKRREREIKEKPLYRISKHIKPTPKVYIGSHYWKDTCISLAGTLPEDINLRK